jgi:hypothetical protein
MLLNNRVPGGRLGDAILGTVTMACLIGMATPAAAQYDWEAVVGGGATVGNGFGNADNQGIGAMAMFNGRLFAASSHHSGETFELWWTEDGVAWTKHADDGFGDANNLGVLVMVVFDGYLYAGTVNTTGAEIWRTDNGIAWTKVADNGIMNANNDAVTSMAVHDGALFAGTENQLTGGQIYRTTNGTLWLPVMIGGFGAPSDPLNRAVASLQSHGGRLYAGTYRDTSPLFNQGAEIRWADSLTGEIVWTSAATAGFGDPYNMAFPSMTVYEGDLYVGTTQLSPLSAAGCEVWRWNGSIWQMVGTGGFGSVTSVSATRFYQYAGDLLVGVENPLTGAKLMRFQDILSWATEVGDAYGNANNIATLGGAVLNGSLFVGTTNITQGAEVHRAAAATIFSDDFETGNADRWSSAVP